MILYGLELTETDKAIINCIMGGGEGWTAFRLHIKIGKSLPQINNRLRELRHYKIIGRSLSGKYFITKTIKNKFIKMKKETKK